MKKPIIGVVSLYDSERESLWMLPGYIDGIKTAGGMPIILPLSTDLAEIEELFNMCDGILLTGGQDVSPAVYHAEKSPLCGEECKERDIMEKQLLTLAIEKDKPLLGICRGIQFINAALGGTLYQDLPTEHPSSAIHSQKPPYDKPSHGVTIVKDSKLYDLLCREELMVNSYHHQAIKDLAPMLSCMAISEDGLCEAVTMEGLRFLWATQWHPELSFKTDENSLKIFKEFIKNAKQAINC